jgi:hypothetical protein
MAWSLVGSQQGSITPLSETRTLLGIHSQLLSLHVFKTDRKCLAVSVPLASPPTMPTAASNAVTTILCFLVYELSLYNLFIAVSASHCFAVKTITRLTIYGTLKCSLFPDNGQYCTREDDTAT